MRDLIWTLIGIWVFYQLSKAFGLFKQNRNKAQNQTEFYSSKQKDQRKKPMHVSGEYVDFEEINEKD